MQICEGARTGISDIIFTLSRALVPKISGTFPLAQGAAATLPFLFLEYSKSFLL